MARRAMDRRRCRSTHERRTSWCVADHIVAEIRAREVHGLVELPQPRSLKPGDHVRVAAGPLRGSLRRCPPKWVAPLIPASMLGALLSPALPFV